MHIITNILHITTQFFIFFLFFFVLNKHMILFHFIFSLNRKNINHFNNLSWYFVKYKLIIRFKNVLILIKPFLECIDSSLSNIVCYSTICKEIRCVALFPTFREDFTNRLDISRRRYFWGLYLNSFRYASFITVGFFNWVIYNIFSSFLIDLEIVFNLLRILILVSIFKNPQYSLLVSK